ncbi:hypothetical protein [Nonomuraea sp. NPDC003201]
MHVEDHVVLEHGADPLAERGRRDVPQIHAVPQDLAAGRIVHPAQKLDEGALAFTAEVPRMAIEPVTEEPA